MDAYSGISLEKLLTLDTLKGSEILAGASGLGKRVTKVNVMEVPDIIEWVSKGEFLITTAYSIKDNIDILLELIPKLNEIGVAGLGIKVGRYISELPQHIIELADRLEFPIIEVPFNVSHTDVISGVLTEVVNDQMNLLIKINRFNREVMYIMMKGGSIKEIAAKLYENVGNSLAIYENMSGSCEILCDEENKDIIENIIYKHINLKYVKERNHGFAENYEHKAYYEHEENYKIYKDEIKGNIVERLTIPIVIEKVEYGFVFVWLDKKELTPLDNMLIDSYVHIIALDFLKKLSLYNVESNYRLEFFNDLLSNNENRQKRALERAKTFNFNKDLKYSVIIVLLKDIYYLESLSLKKNSSNKLSNKSVSDKVEKKKEAYSKGSINDLLFITSRVAKPHKDRTLYVHKNDRIIILFGSEKNKDSQSIKKDVVSFCQNIHYETLKRFHKSSVTIGIGRAYELAQELNKSHRQAKLIVENLCETHEENIKHYDDLGLYRILAFEGLQNELMEFCADTIKPLIEYDKANNGELVKTLKTYFQCHGNMKKISEKMYMHYNTIIYRVQQIKDITGVDLEHEDSRLNLEIALKAMDLIQI